MSRAVKISIVIPVYRNEQSLYKTYSQIKKLFNEKLTCYLLELIFVNDGSDDSSLEILKQIHSGDKRVKIISFTRNFGQVHAVTAGYQHASGDLVSTISADLQDPIELISNMVEICELGSDIVICYRIKRNDDFLSKLFSKIAYSILRITVPKMPTGGFDYVMLKRRAMDTINMFGSKTRFYPSDILWCGYQVSMIPYERKKREGGRSQYTFWKKFKVFLDAILDTSYLPIRVISFAGALLSLLGFLYSLMIILAWINNKTPFSGFAPIIISVLVVGGLNILMLGVIGEYIWRIYEEVRKKPNYVINEILE
jgi:dolichol-phosphate mannosyltransferase